MLKYRGVIKDLYLPSKRQVRVTANDVYEAHKACLKSVNLQKEDVVKIFDSDNTVVYSSQKGFLSKY
jgi:hypothetical protein